MVRANSPMEDSLRRGARREAILAIAGQLFAQHGVAATSMSMVAKALGGSKATLYSYFKSKEELFVTYVALYCAAREAVYDQCLELDGTLEANLARFAEVYLGEMLSEEGIEHLRMIGGQAQRSPLVCRAYYQARRAPPARTLQILLRNVGPTSGWAANAETLADRFMDLLLAAPLQARLCNASPEPSPDEIRRFVQEPLRIFLSLMGQPSRDCMETRSIPSLPPPEESS
jgi:AcrR family transcriptional regulator